MISLYIVFFRVAPSQAELFFFSQVSTISTNSRYLVLYRRFPLQSKHTVVTVAFLFSFSIPFSLCRLHNKALCCATPTPYWFDLSARNICHQLISTWKRTTEIQMNKKKANISETLIKSEHTFPSFIHQFSMMWILWRRVRTISAIYLKA